MLAKSTKLEKQLMQNINDGIYVPGDRLPSRNRLATKFGCSRTTVERALDSLTQAGIIESRKGSGTFVRTTRPQHEIHFLNVVAPYNILEPDELIPYPIFGNDIDGMPVKWISFSQVKDKIEKIAAPGNAVLWLHPDEEMIVFMDYLQSKHTPQLLFNRNYRNFDSVFTDPTASLRDGMMWLMRQAGPEMAMISLLPGFERPYQCPRMLAFYQVALELGVQLSPKMIFSRDFSNLQGEISTIGAALFDRRYPRPKGIVLLNETLPLPLLNYAGNYGLHPGEDFFLLTFDYIPALNSFHGIGMMRQQYPLFLSELTRWLHLVNKPQKAQFSVAIKTELILTDR